jgi:predicted permease
MKRLFRRPLHVAGVVIYAIGIGIGVAVYATVSPMLFRPLPYADPERLVQIHSTTVVSPQPRHVVLAGVAAAIRTSARSIADVAHVGQTTEFTVENVDQPLVVTAVSPNLFRVLGVRALRGAVPDESTGGTRESVLLLTFRQWQAWGAREDLIGQRVGTARVAGILPNDFVLPSSEFNERVDGILVRPENSQRDGDSGRIIIAPVARLAPGVTIAEAQADVDRVMALARVQDPLLAGAKTVALTPLQRGLFLSYRPYLWLLIGITGAILFGACANLATLLVGSVQSQREQTAIRRALGASTARLVWPPMLESAIVCVAGSGIALLCCVAAVPLLRGLVPPELGAYVGSPLEVHTLLAIAVAAALSAIVAGAIPAWHSARIEARFPARPQPGHGSAHRGLRVPLVVESAVAAFLVLAGAVTAGRFLTLLLADPGFVSDRVFVFPASVGSELPADSRRAALRDTLAHLPGVEAVGLTNNMPLGMGRGLLGMRSSFLGRFAPGHEIDVSPGLLEALGATIIAGRPLQEEDEIYGGNVVLNVSAAALLWPGRAPQTVVGQQFDDRAGARATAVGIIRDMRAYPGAIPLPMILRAFGRVAEDQSQTILVVLRMQSAAAPNLEVLNARLAERFGNHRPLRRVVYFPDTLRPWLREPRRQAILFSSLAFVAALLAAVGLYVVSVVEIAWRSHELGIRISMGATRLDLAHLLFAGVAGPVTAGAGAGLLAGWWASRYLGAVLLDAGPPSPAVFVASGLLVVALAAAAATLPIRRSVRIDPVALLRNPTS